MATQTVAQDNVKRQTRKSAVFILYRAHCTRSFIGQASAVALSSFFMIEKMKAADSRHRTISTLQTPHNGNLFHNNPGIDTK